jgi:hypothetical protein
MPNDSPQFSLDAAYELKLNKMSSFFDPFPDIADIRVRVASTKSPTHERPPYREFGFEVPEYFCI